MREQERMYGFANVSWTVEQDRMPRAVVATMAGYTAEELAAHFAEVANLGGTVQDFLDGVDALRQMPSTYPWPAHPDTFIPAPDPLP